jgi:hypothetical protein
MVCKGRGYLLCRMYTAPPSQQVGSTVWTPPVVRGALYTFDIGDNFSCKGTCETSISKYRVSILSTNNFIAELMLFIFYEK